jgi:hypothetical protein
VVEVVALEIHPVGPGGVEQREVTRAEHDVAPVLLPDGASAQLQRKQTALFFEGCEMTAGALSGHGVGEDPGHLHGPELGGADGSAEAPGHGGLRDLEPDERGTDDLAPEGDAISRRHCLGRQHPLHAGDGRSARCRRQDGSCR